MQSYCAKNMTDQLGHVVNTIMFPIINNSIERATNELFNESSRNAIKCKYVRICSKSTFYFIKTLFKNPFRKPIF